LLSRLPTLLGFILGALIAVSGLIRWALSPEGRHRSEQVFAYSALSVALGETGLIFVAWLSRLRPKKFDLYIYQIDRHLFGEPGFTLGRFLSPHPWMVHVLDAAYSLISATTAIVTAIYIYRRPQETNRVVITFFLCFVLAPIFYFAVPVCGPAYAFPNFPIDPGPIVTHSIPLTALPNGMPSVHTATALLAFWFLRRFRHLRGVAFLYLVLIILATMGSGEHYLLDLIMAVPYTAGLLWMTKKIVPVTVANKDSQHQCVTA
jgi:hypothetical protein